MLYWRRPLLIVLMTTCGAALLTSGHLTVHILGSASLYWSFLPLTGLAGLIAADRKWPEPERMDEYFRGYWPWMVWLTMAAAFVGANPGPSEDLFWEITAVGALIASGWLDYRFFGNARKFAISRVVSMPLWLGLFVGSWLWSEISWRLW